MAGTAIVVGAGAEVGADDDGARREHAPRLARRREADGLEEVGLSLGVLTQNRHPFRREREILDTEIAEIPKAEPAQIHRAVPALRRDWKGMGKSSGSHANPQVVL